MAPLNLLHPEFAKIARNPELQIKRKDGFTFTDALKLSFSKLMREDDKN